MMNKFIACLLSVGVALTQGQLVQAAQIEVKWSNPDKYSDIDAGHLKSTLLSWQNRYLKIKSLF